MFSYVMCIRNTSTPMLCKNKILRKTLDKHNVSIFFHIIFFLTAIDYKKNKKMILLE